LKNPVEIVTWEVGRSDALSSYSCSEENAQNFRESRIVEVFLEEIVVLWSDLVPLVLILKSDDEFIDKRVGHSLVLTPVDLERVRVQTPMTGPLSPTRQVIGISRAKTSTLSFPMSLFVFKFVTPPVTPLIGNLSPWKLTKSKV